MPGGAPSADVQKQGAWNAALETGLASPLDDAILGAAAPDLSAVRKLAEIPFDFVRKRVSVVVNAAGRTSLITKGAFHHVLEICTRSADGVVLDAAAKAPPRGALPGVERPGDPRAGRGVTNGRAPASVQQGAGAGSHLRRLPHVLRPAEGGRGRRHPEPGRARRLHQDHHGRLQARHATRRRARRPAGRSRAHRSGPSAPVRRSAVARGRIDGSLRGGGSESEGADHPGASRRWGTSSAFSATA